MLTSSDLFEKIGNFLEKEVVPPILLDEAYIFENFFLRVLKFFLLLLLLEVFILVLHEVLYQLVRIDDCRDAN